MPDPLAPARASTASRERATSGPDRWRLYGTDEGGHGRNVRVAHTFKSVVDQIAAGHWVGREYIVPCWDERAMKCLESMFEVLGYEAGVYDSGKCWLVLRRPHA